MSWLPFSAGTGMADRDSTDYTKCVRHDRFRRHPVIDLMVSANYILINPLDMYVEAIGYPGIIDDCCSNYNCLTYT
jgi:hypothetical protein